jgi:hypothetical protein
MVLVQETLQARLNLIPLVGQEISKLTTGLSNKFRSLRSAGSKVLTRGFYLDRLSRKTLKKISSGKLELKLQRWM